MEGLERVYDVVSGFSRGHIETVATGSRSQREFFHPVDEMGSCVTARRWLDDKRLVFESDEASVKTEGQVFRQSHKAQVIPFFQRWKLSLCHYKLTFAGVRFKTLHVC